MTNAEQNEYLRALKMKQAELEARVRNRDGIAIEQVSDTLDNVRLAQDRDLAIRCIDSDGLLLRQVRAAVERIGEDAYGVCLECGEQISRRRLSVVPWAAYCVRCQEADDARRSPETAFLNGRFLDDAAQTVARDLVTHGAKTGTHRKNGHSLQSRKRI